MLETLFQIMFLAPLVLLVVSIALLVNRILSYLLKLWERTPSQRQRSRLQPS